MKSDTTFQIELDKLQVLMNKKEFDEADKLVSRMLDQYNRLDYDLLLKRARIRQCQMKYEDAILDANLAHNILPQRVEAYHVLSDFLIALNDHQQAFKLLEILNKVEGDQNQIVRNQYEMIKQTLATKKPQAMSKQHSKVQKQIQAVINDCYKVLQPQKDGIKAQDALKQHLKAERMKQVKVVSNALANEVGLPTSLFMRKKKEFREKNNALLDANMMYLSDELDEKETLNEKQKQFMNEKVLGYAKDYTMQEDVPTIEELEEQEKKAKAAQSSKKKKQVDPKNMMVQPLDFTLIKVADLFKNDREHYFMDRDSLDQVECQTCKLINDYTKVCPHETLSGKESLDQWNGLQDQMKEKADENNIGKKIDALRQVMNTLDSMSSIKETAFAIIRGQFSEVLTMFLRKDLNDLLGDESQRSCKQCSYTDGTKDQESLLIIEHALLILNRCLNFQINSLVQNKKAFDNLIISIMDVDNFEYGVSDVIQVCIWDEFKLTMDQALKTGQYRWCTFNYLTQALVNIIILSPDQQAMIKKVKKSGIIGKLLNILFSVKPSIFQYRKNDFKARNSLRYFIGFVYHVFRFLIVCQSIDHDCLSQDPQLAAILSQVLRKYELIKKIMPQNAPLMEALQSDNSSILFFRHNEGNGCHLNDYYLSRKVMQETNDKDPINECDNCGKKEGDSELKLCSRCKKVYYCSRECQKKAYRVHKRYCISLSQNE